MKIIYSFMIVAVVFTLAACTDDSPIDEPIDNENPEEEPMEPTVCMSNEYLEVDKTVTLNHRILWRNSTTCENLEYTLDGIRLVDSSRQGTLETNPFIIDSFNEIVPTWNVLIDQDSQITIMLSIGNDDGFSDYFIMGTWLEDSKRSFSGQDNDYGKVYIDTLVSKYENIDRFKFKIIFNQGSNQYPLLQNVSVTTIPNDNVVSHDYSTLIETEINVVSRQQLSIPSIGNSICSPTSTSMVLSYYGHHETQADVAGLVFDHGASIYGNWSFNASYAGGFNDTYSRVEYINNVETMMQYINQDIPLVVSIKTQDKNQLQGSIMPYPSGHLVVLTGFKQIDDVWYAIVQDPAEYTDENVRREYILDEFLAAMSGYVYVITNEEL